MVSETVIMDDLIDVDGPDEDFQIHYTSDLATADLISATFSATGASPAGDGAYSIDNILVIGSGLGYGSTGTGAENIMDFEAVDVSQAPSPFINLGLHELIDGLNFYIPNGNIFVVEDPTSCPQGCADNGSQILASESGGPNAGGPLTISRPGGEPFSLIQFDGAEGFRDGIDFPNATSLTVVGILTVGTTISETFPLDSIIDSVGPLADFETFVLAKLAHVELESVTIIPMGLAPDGGGSYSIDNIIWHGAGFGSSPCIGGDDMISVNGMDVTGELIGESSVMPLGASQAYRADITALGLVTDGANSLSLDGMSFSANNDSAGIIVIYDDATMNQKIQILDGHDFAADPTIFIDPLDRTMAQTFTFNPLAFLRPATLDLLLDDGEVNRSDKVEITIDGITTPFDNLISSANGAEADALGFSLMIPANATEVTVQIIPSSDASLVSPDSVTWYAAVLAMPAPAAAADDGGGDPNGENDLPTGVNNPPTADAGLDQTVDCATVTLDGSGSFDPDGETDIDTVVITVTPDVTKPELIGVPADATVTCCVDAPAPSDVTAEDACDGIVPVSFTEETIGQAGYTAILRTWTATDSSGNSVSKSQVITEDCSTNCVHTSRYWKKHPAAWPVEELEIGCDGNIMTKAELVEILESHTRQRGDITMMVAQQLIAAKLNVAQGACPNAEVLQCIEDADDFLCTNPLGSAPGGPERWTGLQIRYCLLQFNCGQKGTPHCTGEAETNDPPVTQGNAELTPEETAVFIDALANDMDPNGDDISVLDVTNPSNGTATVMPNGDIRYVPNPGYCGSDSCTYSIGDGRGGFAAGMICVFVDGEAPPTDCTDVIGAEIMHSWVRFNGDEPEYAAFYGALSLQDGNMAPDFRSGNIGMGSLKVSFGDDASIVGYQNDDIIYEIKDNNPTDNREKWKYKADHKEKVTFRWKNSQKYDAKRDPNLPNDVGSLKTRFIHSDETRFNYRFGDATLPITIDGITILTVYENGDATSLFPFRTNHDRIDVLYPDQLEPGSTIYWYRDGDASDGLTDEIYCQEASEEEGSSGAGSNTYFPTDGRFWIKVPITGITKSMPQQAKVEFSIGEAGVTMIGCGEFDVTTYEIHGKNWRSRKE